VSVLARADGLGWDNGAPLVLQDEKQIPCGPAMAHVSFGLVEAMESWRCVIIESLHLPKSDSGGPPKVEASKSACRRAAPILAPTL